MSVKLSARPLIKPIRYTLSSPHSRELDRLYDEALLAGYQRKRRRSASARREWESALKRLQTDSAELSRSADKNRSRLRVAAPALMGLPLHSARSLPSTLGLLLTQSLRQRDVLSRRGQALWEQLKQVARGDCALELPRSDHRFRDSTWHDNPFYRALLQSYLALGNELQQWAEELELGEDDRRRARFLVEQVVAACAPSNTFINPLAVKRSLQTGGHSRLQGLQHLWDSVRHNGGMPRQACEKSFVLGSDLATSDGAVVYRNDTFELIQYTPRTALVHRQPLLLIPPQINKFYIFDLSPANSLVRYLLEQGIQVFVVSWRMPSRAQADWGIAHYVKRLLHAVEACQDITGSHRLHVVSACAGGLTAMSLLTALQRRAPEAVGSHTLLVTALRADGRSQLELFATRELLEWARRWTQRRGVMDGRQLARLFAWMRPTELVWNFWVNNVLLGKEPPVLDVLFWDSDSTRLPAALHSDFIEMFVNDVFAHPGAVHFGGMPLDLGSLAIDTFAVAGSEDYLMPWQSCLETAQLLGGDTTFVLSSSGHIQSVLRPPGIAGTEYFTNAALMSGSEQWMKGSTRHEGSWWPMWAAWLTARSGSQVEAPRQLGSSGYPALYAAPGTYVLERA